VTVPEHPMIILCPLCPARIQRTREGTLLDGMNAHLAIVHRRPPLKSLADRTEINA